MIVFSLAISAFSVAALELVCAKPVDAQPSAIRPAGRSLDA
jgi:hypothetical protein